MVDEPKPKNTGRRRISDLNKTLTVKEKKAKKSAQEKLADKKKELDNLPINIVTKIILNGRISE